MTVDLGYFVNTGWTEEVYNHKEEDDWFVLQALVEMSDYHGTDNGALLDVHVSVDFGSVIVISKN